MPILPQSRPQQKREISEKMIRSAGVTDQVVLLGIRGYYLDSMGEKGKNDRGIYDDAIFVVSPSTYSTFNANTDPSIFRAGIAVLKTGVHRFKKGNHGISRPDGGYPALRPANREESLPVTRDGSGDSMGIAINLHRGSYNSTSSAGCQTIYPAQWDSFINLVYGEMNRYSQKTIPYVLTENKPA
jgi:lysozyme